MPKVITYAYAYIPGEATLCARHAEAPEVPLGPVQHGQHEGPCDACEAPIPCRSCGSTACKWPGECDDLPTGSEDVLALLNDLIEWDAFVGPHENEVWTRARAIRDRLVVK